MIVLEVGTMERSLYDRLGGTEAITAVVRAVVDRQSRDDRINQKFARTNIEHHSKLSRSSAFRAECNVLRNFMTRRMRYLKSNGSPERFESSD
jgi:hypothetical protein